jgi:hypothetical protein
MYTALYHRIVGNSEGVISEFRFQTHQNIRTLHHHHFMVPLFQLLLYFQVTQMGVDDHGSNSSALYLYWWIRNFSEPLQFLPSYTEVFKQKNVKWINTTWTDHYEYLFSNLKPYTVYNLTVYVKVRGQKEVYPPAKYVTSITGEGGKYI